MAAERCFLSLPALPPLLARPLPSPASTITMAVFQYFAKQRLTMGALGVLVYTLVFLIGVCASAHHLDIPPVILIVFVDPFLQLGHLSSLATWSTFKVNNQQPASCGLYHCKPPDTLCGASLVCLASLGKVKVQANHPALCGPYQHGCIPESTTTPACLQGPPGQATKPVHWPACLPACLPTSRIWVQHIPCCLALAMKLPCQGQCTTAAAVNQPPRPGLPLTSTRHPPFTPLPLPLPNVLNSCTLCDL